MEDVRIFGDLRRAPRCDRDPTGLYTERYIVPRRESRLVISACLFRPRSGPGRPFAEYVAGLVRSVGVCERAYPDWNFRLYLDVSAGSAPGAAELFAELRRLGAAHHGFECVAVRSCEPDTSYLPSTWRFLAAFDPDVDTAVMTDLDQTVHPLYMHYVRSWGRDDGASLLYLAPTNYRPPQCVPDAVIQRAAGGDPDDVLCPCAQFVAARGGLPTDAWARTMRIVGSKRLARWARWVFGDGDLRRHVQTRPAMMQWSLAQVVEAGASPSYTDALRAALTDLSGSGGGEDLRSTAKSILQDPSLFRWTEIAFRPAESQPRTVLGQIRRPGTRDHLRELLEERRYGVDEYALYLLAAVLPVALLRAPDPSRWRVRPQTTTRMILQHAFPRLLVLVEMRVYNLLPSRHAPMFGNLIEYVARCLVIADTIRPGRRASPRTVGVLRRFREALVDHARLLVSDALPDVTPVQWSSMVEASLTGDPAWITYRRSLLGADRYLRADVPDEAIGAWSMLRDHLLMEVGLLHSFAHDLARLEAFGLDFSFPGRAKKSVP